MSLCVYICVCVCSCICASCRSAMAMQTAFHHRLETCLAFLLEGGSCKAMSNVYDCLCVRTLVRVCACPRCAFRCTIPIPCTPLCCVVVYPHHPLPFLLVLKPLLGSIWQCRCDTLMAGVGYIATSTGQILGVVFCWLPSVLHGVWGCDNATHLMGS